MKVFVDRAAGAALEVKRLTTRPGGWVGLWVGNTSPGDFANVTIAPNGVAAAQAAPEPLGKGKSTAVEELAKRLGKTFAVARAHLGKPPKSWTTRGLRNIARGRSAYLLVAQRLGRQAPSRATEHAVLATALARDRFHTAGRIRRIATNGGLVLCDRFPLPELKLMDGPRVERVRDPNRWRRLTDRLAARERRYYRAITPPDVLIVLLVDPEIAVVRQSTESADSIRSRWREVLSVDWERLPAHVVDAGQPREAVLSRLESLIWSEI